MHDPGSCHVAHDMPCDPCILLSGEGLHCTVRFVVRTKAYMEFSKQQGQQEGIETLCTKAGMANPSLPSQGRNLAGLYPPCTTWNIYSFKSSLEWLKIM